VLIVFLFITHDAPFARARAGSTLSTAKRSWTLALEKLIRGQIIGAALLLPPVAEVTGRSTLAGALLRGPGDALGLDRRLCGVELAEDARDRPPGRRGEVELGSGDGGDGDALLGELFHRGRALLARAPESRGHVDDDPVDLAGLHRSHEGGIARADRSGVRRYVVVGELPHDLPAASGGQGARVLELAFDPAAGAGIVLADPGVDRCAGLGGLRVHGVSVLSSSGFPGGLGNTQHDDARFATLYEGVVEKVFDRLPDETWVYPGHGKDTTLGDERPHLQEWADRGW